MHFERHTICHAKSQPFDSAGAPLRDIPRRELRASPNTQPPNRSVEYELSAGRQPTATPRAEPNA